MGKFTLENQGSDVNLVYEVGEEEKVDSFAKGMLQNNDIEGVMKPAFMQKDAQQYVKYNVTSRLPLSEYFQGKLTKEKIASMFLSMASALENAEEYMLMPESFLLDTEHVYVDLSKKEASLIYLPIENFSQGDSLKDFCKKILLDGVFEEYEDLSYVGKILNFFNQNKGESPEQIKKFMKGLLDEGNVLAKPEKRTLKPEPKPVSNTPSFKPAQGQGNFKPVQGSVSQESQPPRQVPPAPMEKPAVPPFLQRQGQGMPSQPQTPPAQQLQTPPASEKKKGLFGGREDKKAAKEAAKAAKEAQKAAKKAAKQGGSPVPGMPPAPGMPPIPGVPPAPGMPSAQGQQLVNGAAGTGFQAPPAKKGGFHLFKGKEPAKGEEPVLHQNPGISPAVPAQHPFPQPSAPQFHRLESQNVPIQQAPVSSRPSAPQAAPAPQPFKVEINADENKTIIIGGGDDSGSTMVLGYGSEQKGAGGGKRTASITRRKNGQSMIINKDVFHMGKESSFADFFIGDNRTISAAHADIICDEGKYFIRDMNSLNHTFVNNTMVMAGEMKPLESGDVIRLSDEEFDFKIN